MQLALRVLAFAIVVMTSLPVCAETEVELRTRVVSHLRLVHVQSQPMPRSRFVRDDDPQTIEIVRTDQKGINGSVSDDGQVIYLSLFALSKSEETLVEKAFEIHFARARAGQSNPSLELP